MGLPRRKLHQRGEFRLKERHLWPSQFRHGDRSVRVEWERIQKTIAQLPHDDLPEALQSWLLLLENTDHAEVRVHLRTGDWPFFDAWAHRLHILEETMRDLGYGLAARAPLVYANYVTLGLATAAQGVFHAAKGPKRFSSAFVTTPARTGARSAADDPGAPRPERAAAPPPTAREDC